MVIAIGRSRLAALINRLGKSSLRVTMFSSFSVSYRRKENPRSRRRRCRTRWFALQLLRKIRRHNGWQSVLRTMHHRCEPLEQVGIIVAAQMAFAVFRHCKSLLMPGVRVGARRRAL